MMGNILKEVLKALCGANRWSYAVLWKFALQNPKILVWEECYFAPSVLTQIPYSVLSFLRGKMMVKNHVNVVGRGLVGEVAFTGNHMWILSENHHTETYPAEILKDVSQQFSVGIQTIAVIPIVPHGVIQLGSYLRIPEDVSFVSDSILFVTQNLVEKELIPEMRAPVYPGLATLHKFSMISVGSFSADDQRPCGSPGCHEKVRIAEPRKFEISSVSKLFDGLCRSSCSNTKLVLDTDSPSDGYQVVFENVVGSDCLINGIENSNSSKKVSCFSDRINNIGLNEGCVQPQSEDNSFNILGVNFESELFCNQHSTTPGNLDRGVFSSNGTNYLLDAVDLNVYPSVDQVLDDCVSCLTTLNSMSSQFKVSNRVEDEHVPEYSRNSGAYSPTSSMYDSWSKKGHKMKRDNIVFTEQSRKLQEMNKVKYRKRHKLGKNSRPRPNDRQMIQDRLKELRELVPNGAKCSIEVLLERTAKHMLSLQSVEKHKDKLSHIPESKIVCEDSGPLSEEGFDGGATWAYEVGSQLMLFPIIVKDLNKPRQMLVEMLCDKRGSFLEVADVLRGLGLTILKGQMEACNDKIWARFTIEAHRHISRVQIFVTLARMLEKKSNGHSSYSTTQ